MRGLPAIRLSEFRQGVFEFISMLLALAILFASSPLTVLASSGFNEEYKRPSLFQAPDIELFISTSNDRSGEVALEGGTVSGDIYVFLLPEDGAESVVFLLDGVEHQSERSAPWDFAGGGADTANAFDTTAIDDGTHTITALVELSDGGTVEVSADFVIDNPVEP